jgi:intein/homing endonuclease
LEDVERAYIAGLFDGEGCPSVVYAQYKKNGRVYGSCKVILVISNQDKQVLKQVRLLFGKGGIYSQDKKGYNNEKRQKTSYDFRLSKPSEIIEFAELIRPYVRVKKADLENIYNASNFILKVRGSDKRHRWTKEEIDEFRKFERTSKDLKGVGKRGRPRKYPLQ